jgi:hypothetical protein
MDDGLLLGTGRNRRWRRHVVVSAVPAVVMMVVMVTLVILKVYTSRCYQHKRERGESENSLH